MPDDAIAWRAISCPFCNKVLARAYDKKELPEAILESGDEPSFEIRDHCEHVAFYRSWAFVEPEVPGQHEAVMTHLVKRLQEDETLEGELGDIEPAERLSDMLEFMDVNPEETQRLFGKKLKGFDLKVAVDYFATGDGVRGDDVMEHLYIFIRKKQAQPQAKRTASKSARAR